MDKNLNLSDKILFENKKPQSKHLQTRVDYLIKVLSKEMQSVNSNKKPKNNFTNNQNTFDESNGFPNSSSRRKGKQPVINDDPPKKNIKKTIKVTFRNRTKIVITVINRFTYIFWYHFLVTRKFAFFTFYFLEKKIFEENETSNFFEWRRSK